MGARTPTWSTVAPMPISEVLIRKTPAPPPGKTKKLFDGNGLYLELISTGAKRWRIKYRYGGKEKRLSLGKYPTVSLKDARAAHLKIRQQLSDGIDPSTARKSQKPPASNSQGGSFETMSAQRVCIGSFRSGYTIHGPRPVRLSQSPLVRSQYEPTRQLP